MSVIRHLYTDQDTETDLNDLGLAVAEISGELVHAEVHCLICGEVIPPPTHVAPVIYWNVTFERHLYFHPKCVPLFALGLLRDAEEIQAIADVNARYFVRKKEQTDHRDLSATWGRAAEWHRTVLLPKERRP